VLQAGENVRQMGQGKNYFVDFEKALRRRRKEKKAGMQLEKQAKQLFFGKRKRNMLSAYSSSS